MMGGSKKGAGDFEKFKRNLKDVIDSFERAKEWADLSNCLQKVKKQFELHQNTDIPQKKDLAKRLAQCLNPDLAVIHQLTLEIYGLIFQRQIELSRVDDQQKGEWGSDLGLFLSGLFNFYQFAAFEVKDQFLNIIDQYILSFDKELLLSLPGFMICMLPALEDQNAEKLKKVEEILRKTEQAVGTSEFYGVIWETMLRTSRARVSAIKYLEKRIPKDLEAAKVLVKNDQVYISRFKIKVLPYKNKEGVVETRVTLEKDPAREEEERRHLALSSLEDYFFFYYPMKEKLFVNSMLAGLADTNVYVNRGVLDFLISHAPITGKVNREIENVKLVEGALITLNRKDFAFLKKFFTWVLGHLDEDEDYRPNESDPAIKTLVPALKCLYKKFMDKNEIIKHTQKERAAPQAPQNIPILISQTLFNDNFVIIEPILLQVSVDFIKYIKFYFYTQKDAKSRFFENVKNLFDMLPTQQKCIWVALGELLSNEINKGKIEANYQVEAIELIDFCLRDFKLYFEKAENDISDFLGPILSTLLSGVSRLSNQMKNLENTISALDLISNIIQVFDCKSLQLQSQEAESLQKSVENFNEFYVELCNTMIAAEDIMDLRKAELFKLRLDTFKKSSQILTAIQQFSSVTQSMPQWLESVINCSKVRKTKIALVSTETFDSILQKEYTSPHDPFMKLQNLIVNSGYESLHGSGGQSSSILAALESPQPNLKNHQEKALTQAESKQLMAMNRNSTPNKKLFGVLQDTRNHHCTDIIKNLWSLLDDEEDHQKIVFLLKKFDLNLPAIFSEVVITDLLEKAPREVKERGIKKFSIFWNLTASEYPGYKPFHEKDTSDRRYGALHNVLHFLEQNDPTLRLSCRSWLQDSKSFYNRILDPLMEEFLQNSKVFVTFSKQIFFYDMYDTKIVSENFGKLRNIILNTQDEMIRYMINRWSSEHIQKEFLERFEWMLPKTEKKKPSSKQQQHKYLEIVVYITLQFIMGQAVQSVDNGLYQESQTVNASACEFMELILKSLESHPESSNRIAHIIVDPILKTFRQVIDNQNHAMQVHLLNLLKVIFFECNFNTPESKENCERIFKDSSLIESIIKGMKNEGSFVRFHFIQFATAIMEKMKQLLKAVDFTPHIKRLIDCFCDLMNHVDVNLFSSMPQQQQQLMSQSGEADGKSSSSLQLGGPRANATSRTTTVAGGNQGQQDGGKAEGKLVINQESDIAILIQGFKKILSDALGIYMEDGGVKGVTQQVPTPMMDQMLDSSSQYRQAEGASLFGKVSKLFGGGGDIPIMTNTDEQIIRDAIYQEFKKIIVACLHCWNDLSIFTPKDYHFSRSGVFPYTLQDDGIMNQLMERSYEKFKEHTQNQHLSRFDESSRGSIMLRDTVTSTAQNQQQPIVQFTLVDYIRMKTNTIQRQVLDFLRPFSDTSSNHLIEGILMVWMDKKNLDPSTNIHKSLEKIIQILQSVKVKHYHAIECVNLKIEKMKWKTGPPKSKKKVKLERHDLQRETLLCQFLYTYLLYNVQQLFTKGDETSVIKLYKAVYKFIQNFKESRHPSTICWLIEILNILSIKFSPMDAYRGDQKLKKDYFEVMSELLESIANILSDNYKVEYENYGFLMAFSPQSYELLRRFSPKLTEYTSQSVSRMSTDQKPSFTASNQLMQTQSQINAKKSLSATGGQAQQMQSMKRPGGSQVPANTGGLGNKMQPLQSHNPPSEDVEDEEELMGAVTPSNQGMAGFGINSVYGLKLGFSNSASKAYAGGSSAASLSQGSPASQPNEFPDQAEYANNDYFFEEGNSTSKFMVTLASYINYPSQDCPPWRLTLYQKFFTLVTLKGVLYTTVHSIVGGSSSHTSFEKIQNALKLIVDEILKILSMKQSSQQQATDSKSQVASPIEMEKERAYLREVVTDFFAALMDSANLYLVKRYKQEISELFFHDTFFQMSRRNLKKWSKIINHFISDHKDAVFDDLLYKWNTQAGLLTSKETENKQKIIALKRVSFLVYSGNVDQYDDKLDLLLKKMTEGLKMSTNKKFPELQRQLFLLTRVLLLRLGSTSLTDALRKLWPHLLNELESIFRESNAHHQPLQGLIGNSGGWSKSGASGQDKLKERMEEMGLVFEAIKVIELMSALNIEDFTMNQWIFLIDAYGMKLDIETQQNLQQLQGVRKPQDKGSSDDFQILDKSDYPGSGGGGIFQPSIIRFMPTNSYCSFYDQHKGSGGSPQTSKAQLTEAQEVEEYVRGSVLTKQIEQRQSSIQVDRNSYDQEQVLETFALGLQLNLAVLNTERTDIDKQNFEALIEKDFIEQEPTTSSSK